MGSERQESATLGQRMAGLDHAGHSMVTVLESLKMVWEADSAASGLEMEMVAAKILVEKDLRTARGRYLALEQTDWW